MSEGVPYADILILALIAGFILLRLRSVLGSRSDDGAGFFGKPVVPEADRQEPIVQLDEKSLKPKAREEADPALASLDASVASVVTDIKVRDPQFSATRFLQGARGAYEMVFDAFAKGDKQTLRMLLADSIFQHFDKEIDERQAQENKPETTLVSVTAKTIVQATLTGNIAHLIVEFDSEQIMVVRGAKGEIVEGNPSDIHRAEERWTFERDVTSKNPNWKIIET